MQRPHCTIWLAIHPSTRQPRTAGLQSSMALSYVWVTAILVLILEILAMIGLSLILFLVVTPFVYTLEAKQMVQHYVLVASLQANAATLNPESTFQESQVGTLTLPAQSPSSDSVSVPYITTQVSDTHILAIALLIAPDGSILASSYPHHYPLHAPIASLFPTRSSLLARALIGTESSGQETTLAESRVYAMEPVWSRQMRPIGAVYVQITNLPSTRNIFTLISPWPGLFFISGLILLVVITPIGGLFGILTTRGLIRRIRLLVKATLRFADGDYTQRVIVGHQDEIGQLEHHFNHMALQLSASIQQQQILTEQNARLAERTRMSRDLHDNIKQQVFALATQIGTALILFDHKHEETRTHLEIANELAYQVRQELTGLIQELRLSLPVERGINQSIREELERWSRQHDIPVTMHLQEGFQLPAMTTKELLSVVQEALSNVARHSQATHVQLSLEQEQAHIVLTIADNGYGFDRKMVSSQCVGLQSMQERLEEIDGIFQLQSTIGEGTLIRCVIRTPPCNTLYPSKRQMIYIKQRRKQNHV